MLKWGLAKLPGGHKKGVFRATHTCTPFFREYPQEVDIFRELYSGAKQNYLT